MAFQPLDGPAKQIPAITLTTSTVVEVKSGTPLDGRAIITIQPLDGDIWVYFGDGINIPSAATVAADGFLHYRHADKSYEAGDRQPVFIVARTITTSVRIAERA